VNWQSDQDGSRSHLGELSIGEVCERTGLSSRTVRYYEELGLLPGVRRRSSGRRVYGADELERLRFIQRLKTLGLALQEIKELNALYGLAGSTRAMLIRLDDLLESHQVGLDERIEQLIVLRDEMRSYREHVAKRIEAFGAEAVADTVSGEVAAPAAGGEAPAAGGRAPTTEKRAPAAGDQTPARPGGVVRAAEDPT
jgi:DNA-binding transcriptional MerR regulator